MLHQLRRQILAIISLTTLTCGMLGCNSSDQQTSQQLSYQYKTPPQLSDDWQVAHIQEVEVDSQKIAEMMDAINSGTYINIDSFLLARDGKLVVDELIKTALRGHDHFVNNTDLRVHSMQSTTKSFVSALAGIAIDQGYITSTEEKFYDFFPEYSNFENWHQDKATMTLANVLNMRHGWNYDEWSAPHSSDQNSLFYLYRHHPDLVKGLLDFPMSNTPGSTYAYSTIASHAIGAAVANRTGMPIDVYADLVLFQPMGIESAIWAYSEMGRANTGGGLWLAGRDMMKFGQMYLDKGIWNNTRIISEEWINRTFDRKVVFNFGYSDGYSFQWWTKDYRVGGETIETFFTAGNGGQFIYVIPQKNAVVAFTGGNYDNMIMYQPDELMQKYVLPSLN